MQVRLLFLPPFSYLRSRCGHGPGLKPQSSWFDSNLRYHFPEIVAPLEQQRSSNRLLTGVMLGSIPRGGATLSAIHAVCTSMETTLIERTSGVRKTFGLDPDGKPVEDGHRTFHQEPMILNDGRRALLLIGLNLHFNDKGLPCLVGSCKFGPTFIRTRKVGEVPEGGDPFEIIQPPEGECFTHPVKGNVEVVISPAGEWEGDEFIWESDDRTGVEAVSEDEAKKMGVHDPAHNDIWWIVTSERGVSARFRAPTPVAAAEQAETKYPGMGPFVCKPV